LKARLTSQRTIAFQVSMKCITLTLVTDRC